MSNDREGLSNCTIRVVFWLEFMLNFSKFRLRQKCYQICFFSPRALNWLEVDTLNCVQFLLKITEELVVLPLALRFFWNCNFSHFLQIKTR